MPKTDRIDRPSLCPASVVVDNVVRTFTADVEGEITGLHSRSLGNIFRRRRPVKVTALRGVSFVARRGQAIGIVGANGSGKSTLLRIIAGVDRPSGGRVMATSQPVLLGVNAALQAHLSGLANVRLGLLSMGFAPNEVEERIPQVLKLAGIGEAIHRPMRTYSSGMGSRLRFALAASTEPDIMLIDEALATGDAASKDRAERRMREIQERAGTIFLVSHAAQTIEEMCTRAIWLHDGSVISDGPAVDVARAYRWWAWNVAQDKPKVAANLLTKAVEDGIAERQRLEVRDVLGGGDAARQTPAEKARINALASDGDQ